MSIDTERINPVLATFCVKYWLTLLRPGFRVATSWLTESGPVADEA